jgi:hypothetical protein
VCQRSGGCGTVFKLTPKSTGYTETVLWRFRSNGKRGSRPATGVILDKAGDLYGTTLYGGSKQFGVVFEVKR